MKPGKKKRPKLPPVSEQMKAWSSALAAEVGDWPDVSPRSFFGFTALYRKGLMFAALPRTRAMATPNSLVFKIEKTSVRLRSRLAGDPRIGSMDMQKEDMQKEDMHKADAQKARWFTFELSSDADLHDALDWLGRAYEAAAKSSKSR